MNHALVAPGEVLWALQPDTYDAYHLALGPHLLKESNYLEFYHRAHNYGHFIMVDNGTAEGESVNFNILLDFVIRERFDEIVLPDTLRDTAKTVEQFKTFVESVPVRMRAICPQGTNATEYMMCLRMMDAIGDFRTICVPKHLKEARVEILHMLHNDGWDDEHNIHLLGLSANPLIEIPRLRAAETTCKIRGLDTAAPLAWAQHARYFRDPDIARASVDWTSSAYNKEMFTSNMTRMRELCHGNVF